MANFSSMDEMRRKEEEERKARGETKETESWNGGEKSGVMITNPEDDAFNKMARAAAAQGPLPDDHVKITVYRNGFTVNGGDFRPNSDPINRKFLDELAAGRCPAELEAGKTEPVHIAMEDKRGDDYKEPPKPTYIAFSGEGNSLGGASSSAAAVAVSAAATVAVDASKAKGKIQIRFHDGQKKAQEFNEDQTVGDLRKFCSETCGGQPMTVMGGFPPKPLADDAQTLKAAGLLNSQVTTRPS
jgi:UBX domain-containing protein 1